MSERRARSARVRIRVATVNLGRGVSVARFVANVALIVRRLSGAFIGFQEIDEDDVPNEHRIIRHLMRARWRFAGWRTRVPIAIPRIWRKLAENVVRGTSGILHVGPERLVTSTVVEHRKVPGVRVGLVNYHTMYPNPKHTDQQRAAAREGQREVNAAVAAEVLRLLESDPELTVIVLADTNDRDAPKPHPKAVLLIGENAIDRVWVIRRTNGPAVTVRRTTTVRTNIDGHRGRGVVLDLVYEAA